MNLSELYKSEDYRKYLEDFITENRKLKFNEVLENRTKHFCIAVEDVYQLHNTSAVMRSCEVFGIQDLHMIEQKFSKTIDKEIALGAEKWVDIHRHSSTQNCLDSLKNQGYQIVATTPHADAHVLDDFDISKPSAIFFGTEKNGLSQEIMDQADAYIKIPMYGFTESLNISVSAAIVINNITNKLRNSTLNWKLSEEEFLSKKIDWMRKSIKDIDFITERFLAETTK
ncbi:tRNA (guanosine-2'-O-)-methyltransferase [Paenimyroides ummariense]|uniref:tRNA (guanosine(18)-2'-O)-methyltransferase n=1 Tax=Paenimyroides ummariense TaxID=913024 RepID=A0A1I4YBK4_9FLAO|nr:RNA methyltransferase [Paenimyroides ummariense]SFN35434.1 tRNA (guanosine-2'-O-)-methyltransferase [Paenimyroides ummariense]